MIWNFLKKNRLIILSLVGLSSLFFSLSSASAVSAYSIDLNNIFFQNMYDWANDNGGTYNSSRRYGYYPVFQNILVPATGDPNLDYATPYDAPQGAFATTFTTNGMTIMDNAMSFHGELNIVAFNKGYSRQFYFPTGLLDNLRVKSCANQAIASSSVTYALTDWTPGPAVPGYYYEATTLTLYIDITLTSLDVSTTQYLACTIDVNPSALQNPGLYNAYYRPNYSTSVRTYLYAEKFDTTYLFFNTPNEALQQTQINIMNVQNQLLQRQYEQEQQDRDNIQNVSNDATADGDNASASAENATSSLLGAITNIYGVLLHPTTSNCNIGPINLYNQLDLGTLDMCTFSIPQPLFAIGALVLIGLVILLAWSVLHATLSLYKDLFGGKG